MPENAKDQPFQLPPRERARLGPNQLIALRLLVALGGAIMFSFPMLMTMEMWWIGYYIEPIRLAVFMLITFILVIRLAYRAGFEKNHSHLDAVLDVFIAYALGFFASALMLAIFGVLSTNASLHESFGDIAIQAAPASLGAILSRVILSAAEDVPEQPHQIVFVEGLFYMIVGALYLSLALAPTEEMILIAFKMNEYQAIALVLICLLVMHAFVATTRFQQHAIIPRNATFFALFIQYTIVGYMIALLLSLLILWIFGRTDGMAFKEILLSGIVVSFPATLGAASARTLL